MTCSTILLLSTVEVDLCNSLPHDVVMASQHIFKKWIGQIYTVMFLKRGKMLIFSRLLNVCVKGTLPVARVICGCKSEVKASALVCFHSPKWL